MEERKSISNGIERLEHLSEPRMLLRISMPVIMSLLVQGLYSLVDSVFLSRLGEEALSAVSLSFVIQSLSSTFFTGIATGMNSLLSRAVGRKDALAVKQYAVGGMLTQALFAAAFMLFGFFGVPGYFTETTSQTEVIRLGTAYLTPCMIGVSASAAQILLERMLQSTGMTRHVLRSQVIGTAVNLVLDPLLIFGRFGFPELGIAGAAYATIAGQISASAAALYFNLRYNRGVFEKIFRFDCFQFSSVLDVCRIGIPTALAGIGGSIGNYFINRILISFSATANAAFGIYTKLQSIVLMPPHGLAMGLVTVLAYFYGQRNYTRFRKALVSSEKMLFFWGVVCFLTFNLFPKQLLSIFNPSEQMIKVGTVCFRMIGTTYLLSGLMLGFNAYYQAMGKSIYSLIITLFRQILVRIPIAYWLASFGEIDLIWWCWPISEIVSDTVCVLFFIRSYRRFREEERLHSETAGKTDLPAGAADD